MNFLRCVLAALLLLWILAFAGCAGVALVEGVEEFSDEGYVRVDASVVNPAHEGKKVQLKAPAYTDEWLELRAIGVRMQALRLELNTNNGYWRDNVWVTQEEYRGYPLKSCTAFAQRIRMGAYELKLSEDRVRALRVKLPSGELRLPESWVPHCRVLEDEPRELRLELAGEPPRTIACSMVENGRELVVRGIQRGNGIFPIHAIWEDEREFLASDRYLKEKALRDTVSLSCCSLVIPALLLGVFRLFRWRVAGRCAPLAIWLMVALDAAAFLCCGAWKYPVAACLAAVLVSVSLWQIVRIVRRFRVDSAAE